MVNKLEISKTFKSNFKAWDGARIIANQGSSRSGKTYAILQLLVVKLLEDDSANKMVSIVRKTMPALRKSVMRDFFYVLDDLGLYNANNWKKNEKLYTLNGHTVEFFSTDQSQKVRGSKRNYLFCNEANELDLDAWRQLSMRTTDKIILDYNPSDAEHFIYSEILPREDCTYIKSTFRDNPFLHPEVVKEIERYKEVDWNYWKVFGLGERGISQATVFTNNWKVVKNIPEKPDNSMYGIDWGYNHPNVLVRVDEKDGVYYWTELYRESGKLVSEFIEDVKKLNLNPSITIVADSAEPQYIKEFKTNGITNIVKANKKDKLAQLNLIKGNKMCINEESTDLIREVKNYKYATDPDGNVLNEVVKVNDDGIDACQYAMFKLLKRGRQKAMFS